MKPVKVLSAWLAIGLAFAWPLLGESWSPWLMAVAGLLWLVIAWSELSHRTFLLGLVFGSVIVAPLLLHENFASRWPILLKLILFVGTWELVLGLVLSAYLWLAQQPHPTKEKA